MQDIILILHDEPHYYNETTTFQRKCKYNDEYIYLIAEYVEHNEIERHICILSRREYPYEIVDDENEWIDAMKLFFNRTFTFEEYEHYFETLSIDNNHFIDIIDEFKEDI